MKKTQRFFSLLMLGAGLTFFAGSCSVKYVSVNANPVGDKVSEISGDVYELNADYSISKAAKNVGIEKIGIVELRGNPAGWKTKVSGN
jgi:hypothetical protein